jgi:hypothetical protein
MTARVLVAYAASTGLTSRLAAEVGTEIAEVSGLEVDVRPITYAPSMEPYRAVFLGSSGHSRAGRREIMRFLTRNAAWLPERRIWVVHRQPGNAAEGATGRRPLRLSRLIVRNGAAPQAYDEVAAGTMSDTMPGLLPLDQVGVGRPG